MKPKTRLIVTIFLGWAGVHRFLDRKIGTGILYLCTLGLCGIGWIVDIIRAIPPALQKQPAEQTDLPKGPLSEPVEETFEAVGVHYYLENVGKLATRNPDWRKTGKALVSAGFAGRRVYRYSYINKPVKLVQENDNPHDRNAVMVQIAGEKVGYIAADEALHVQEILNHRTVCFVSAFIGGGDYKEVHEDGSFDRYENEPFVRVKIRYK